MNTCTKAQLDDMADKEDREEQERKRLARAKQAIQDDIGRIDPQAVFVAIEDETISNNRMFVDMGFYKLDRGGLVFNTFWEEAIKVDPKRALEIASRKIATIERDIRQTERDRVKDERQLAFLRKELAMFQSIQKQAQETIEREGVLSKVRRAVSNWWVGY